MHIQVFLALLSQMTTLAKFSTPGRELEPQEEGQGLAEYALILVMVGVVAMAVLLALGPGIGNMFTNIMANLRPIFTGE